jgi:hypothetical protein
MVGVDVPHPSHWAHCNSSQWGPWGLHPNGLCQGEPLSPYLFIIVADVLQRLIRKARVEGGLAHPLYNDIRFPVLQYADNTLILCKASASAASYLKKVLGDFALATGLSINFLM